MPKALVPLVDLATCYMSKTKPAVLTLKREAGNG
jgi:hypothetical protein